MRKLRALNTPPSVPGLREDVYCTKIGTTHPEEMYIVAGHMDGIGYGEAANDDVVRARPSSWNSRACSAAPT